MADPSAAEADWGATLGGPAAWEAKMPTWIHPEVLCVPLRVAVQAKVSLLSGPEADQAQAPCLSCYRLESAVSWLCL